MSEQPWTIDAIAHAIPNADTRQNFLRAVNLTPLPELPEVLARWQRFVERWRDEIVPDLEAVLEYAKTHNGELPPEYADDGGTEDFLNRLRDDVRKRQTYAA
ncbi:hypothetical protein ABZ626_38100 [Streptomyces longispororuber]|uniref:hypothetical protein n=1 Tax=Streptomyces TaxID=1883 RepID=UPI0024A8970C|nr:hypothetical protein [Streptomyces sp. CC224B]